MQSRRATHRTQRTIQSTHTPTRRHRPEHTHQHPCVPSRTHSPQLPFKSRRGAAATAECETRAIALPAANHAAVCHSHACALRIIVCNHAHPIARIHRVLRSPPCGAHPTHAHAVSLFTGLPSVAACAIGATTSGRSTPPNTRSLPPHCPSRLAQELEQLARVTLVPIHLMSAHVLTLQQHLVVRDLQFADVAAARDAVVNGS
jgi:hypothetical protein